MSSEDTLLALIRDHHDALLRIAHLYAGPSGEEEDLYQEILTQAWKSLPAFRGDAAGGTWLYRVALNTALTWRRRVVRRDTRAADVRAMDAPRHTSQEGALSQADILSDFLSTLSGPDHSVLLLYMEGLPYRQIAEVMGLSESAVGVRLHRMKQSFTKRYLER